MTTTERPTSHADAGCRVNSKLERARRTQKRGPPEGRSGRAANQDAQDSANRFQGYVVERCHRGKSAKPYGCGPPSEAAIVANLVPARGESAAVVENHRGTLSALDACRAIDAPKALRP